MQDVILGAEDQSVYLFIVGSTTFLPLTSVTSASAGLALVYRKGQTGAVTAITASDLAGVDSAHSDGGMIHVNAGLYRVDVPDAAVPTIENEVTTVGGVVTGGIIMAAALIGKQPIGAPAGASIAADLAAIEGQTDDIGVAGAGLTALGDTRLANLDAAISTRGTGTALAAQDIANALKLAPAAGAPAAGSVNADLDTLTAATAPTAATIADAVWDEAVADHMTATTFGGKLQTAVSTAAAIAAAVWAYVTRTLTQGAASVTSAVSGSTVTVYRGTTWGPALTGIADFTGWTKLLVSIKEHESDADSASIAMWQVSSPADIVNDGLLYLNGSPATKTDGAITVVSTTALTPTLKATAADDVRIGTYSYGIKAIDAAGVDLVSIGGTWTVAADIPKAVS